MNEKKVLNAERVLRMCLGLFFRFRSKCHCNYNSMAEWNSCLCIYGVRLFPCSASRTIMVHVRDLKRRIELLINSYRWITSLFTFQTPKTDQINFVIFYSYNVYSLTPWNCLFLCQKATKPLWQPLLTNRGLSFVVLKWKGQKAYT